MVCNLTNGLCIIVTVNTGTGSLYEHAHRPLAHTKHIYYSILILYNPIVITSRQTISGQDGLKIELDWKKRNETMLMLMMETSDEFYTS